MLIWGSCTSWGSLSWPVSTRLAHITRPAIVNDDNRGIMEGI
jgi:hypothetical protein